LPFLIDLHRRPYYNSIALVRVSGVRAKNDGPLYGYMDQGVS